jgi:hypothetical protein
MDVHRADRVNQTGSKTFIKRLLDALFTGIVGPFASDPIVGFPGGAIQAETKKIHILAADSGKDIMKQVAVGINRDRNETTVFRIFNGPGQIRMKGGLTTQEYDIGRGADGNKFIQPGLDGYEG